MRFSLSTPMLSAGLIFLLFLQAVNSLSVSNRGPESQSLTFPLKRIQQRSDIHPQILLQMHINRSIHRLAKMPGGAQPPSARSLEQRLERRMSPLDEFPRKTEIKSANPPAAPNSLGLGIYGADTGYVATIQIGTPPKDFTIKMDSGSADFWVGSEESCVTMNGTSNCGNHQFLGSSSSTFVDKGKSFFLPYDVGQVNGTICQDNVVIAGLTLTSHTFGVANQESIEFSSNSTSYDGVMGLAKSAILSRQRTPTPVEALASAGLIPAPIVSYKLGRGEDNDNDGEITFGALDSTKFEANTLVNLPNINTEGMWEAYIDSASVDGVPLQGFSDQISTILDTGTPNMVLSEEYAQAIHRHIPGAIPDGQGGFNIPCNTTTVVGFTYGGQSFPIDPRDLVGLAVNGSYCASNIAGQLDVPTGEQWIFGDTFLKNAYFSTNIATNILSLARPV